MTKGIFKTKVYYVDTYAQGSTHEMFNSSLFLMCCMIFDTVECRTSESSFLNLKRVINCPVPLNANHKKIVVIQGNGRMKLLLRYIVSALQNVRFLFLAPKNAIVVFPFNNLLSLRLVNFLNKFLDRKLIVFCHNEMEAIYQNGVGFGLKYRLFPRLCQNFFLNPNVKVAKGLYFSVLGDVIKSNLSTIVSADKIDKFISIDHPYIFQDDIIVNRNRSEQFNIGTIGATSKRKGLNEFIEFIYMIPRDLRVQIKLSVTGRIAEDAAQLTRLGVDTGSSSHVLDRKEYNERVKKLDLILFFYPENTYKVTASGAIMDAILHEKPVLALKNDYFEYVFEKFGRFGFLFENNVDMLKKLYELLDEEEPLYFDFKTLKNKFSPRSICHQFSFELHRIGYLSN